MRRNEAVLKKVRDSSKLRRQLSKSRREALIFPPKTTPIVCWLLLQGKIRTLSKGFQKKLYERPKL